MEKTSKDKLKIGDIIFEQSAFNDDIWYIERITHTSSDYILGIILRLSEYSDLHVGNSVGIHPSNNIYKLSDEEAMVELI